MPAGAGQMFAGTTSQDSGINKPDGAPRMLFTPTDVNGAFIIEPSKIADERGFFALAWSRSAFLEQGLNADLVQCNVSFNYTKGTLRGMHYQLAPHSEAKLIRCTKGSVYDVAVDIRRGSPTFGAWCGVVLDASNHRALYVPEGCAHGYLTLEDDCEVFYQMTAGYAPSHARGLRWNDPKFGVLWPGDVAVINERDRTYPDFAAGA
jgi:dTDP-4-dehydrorhamnose 3,5-epimerase